MIIAESLEWKLCHFDQLTTRELYLLTRLRIDVFVVEQACPYPELDGLDILPGTRHLFATDNAQPVAYARILVSRPNDTGSSSSGNTDVHIGRVLVADSHRRQGLATLLMRRALAYCETHHPGQSQALAAQVEVMDFYTALGFEACGACYVEDGIAHVNMRRSANSELLKLSH